MRREQWVRDLIDGISGRQHLDRSYRGTCRSGRAWGCGQDRADRDLEKPTVAALPVGAVDLCESISRSKEVTQLPDRPLGEAPRLCIGDKCINSFFHDGMSRGALDLFAGRRRDLVLARPLPGLLPGAGFGREP